MKANEGRIGNWVLIPTSNEIKIPVFPKKIKAITLFGDFDFTEPIYPDNHIVPAVHCEGVPITEEILLKSGFNQQIDKSISEDVDMCVRHPLYLRWLANDWQLFIKEGGGWFKSVRYVHELQNLYFAITGEELDLTINY